MQQIIFPIADLRNSTPLRLGVGPSFQGRIPLPTARLIVSGVTKDSTGTVLPNCNVTLYRTSDDQVMGRCVSDANGNYSFSSGSLSEQYYVMAYKAGSPDVSGTTLNTLVAV